MAGVLTIDGPSGVGKTTVSKGVAEGLGWAHLDTGAFYRAATIVALINHVDLAIETEVVVAVATSTLEFSAGAMLVDGIDVSESIRSDVVTSAVSQVAAYPAVRAYLVGLQRAWVANRAGQAVVEGRDIGTVVFPDAPLKVFLTARPEIRAARRAGEVASGSQSMVGEALAKRDHIDSTRTASPLQPADDAVTIDTSEVSQQEVTHQILDLAKSRGLS